jgi:hypothetical protein
MTFTLVSFDSPSDRTAPILEVSADTDSCHARTRRELDQVVGELQRTIAQLSAWREFLPDSG